MHGNVWEWCQDTWHESYEGAPTDGSAWESGDLERVQRGGSWFDSPTDCRCTARTGFDPTERSRFDGFRVVCVLPMLL